jgi:parallel beta-helix repeat protein
MKRASLAVVWGLSLMGLLAAGNLNPSGPPTAGTMKPLDDIEPRTAVQSLPGSPSALHVITEPGSYYLTGNITSNMTHAIEIRASDVTVDLMGYRIWSSWSRMIIGHPTALDGIYIIPGQTNIEIRNGSIVSDQEALRRGFRYAIYAPLDSDPEPDVSSDHIRVIGVRIRGGAEGGINMLGYGHLVQDCTVSRTGGDGIYIGTCGAVSGNVCYANTGNGISSMTGSRITANTCDKNTGFGILGGWGCTVVSNTCSLNAYWGISLGGDCLVDQNTAYNNGDGNLAGGSGSVMGTNKQ